MRPPVTLGREPSSGTVSLRPSICAALLESARTTRRLHGDERSFRGVTWWRYLASNAGGLMGGRRWNGRINIEMPGEKT